MAITPSKTWEYSVNHVISAASFTLRNEILWLRLKEILTDTGAPGYLDAAGGALANPTKPWVVIASSDSTTADATDRWAVVADIVGSAAGVAHSWIHLRQVDYFGSGDHLNMLLACEDLSNLTLGYVAYSRGALGWNLDGTITNRPTLESGAVLLQTRDGLSGAGSLRTSDVMWGGDADNNNRILSVRISDDGLAGAWFVFTGGNCIANGGWQTDEGAPASRLQPWAVWYGSTDSLLEEFNWADQWNFDNWLQTPDNLGVEVIANVGIPGFGSGEANATSLNDGFDATRMFLACPLGIITLSAVVGVWTDLWWGSDNNSSGDLAPLTPPTVWASVGTMIIPWPSGVTMTVS